MPYSGEGSWVAWVSSRLAAVLPNVLSGVLAQIDLPDHVGVRDPENFPSACGGVDASRARGAARCPSQRGHAERRGPAAGSGLPTCPCCASLATLEAQHAMNRAPNVPWGSHLVGIDLCHTCHRRSMRDEAYPLTWLPQGSGHLPNRLPRKGKALPNWLPQNGKGLLHRIL